MRSEVLAAVQLSVGPACCKCGRNMPTFRMNQSPPQLPSTRLHCVTTLHCFTYGTIQRVMGNCFTSVRICWYTESGRWMVVKTGDTELVIVPTANRQSQESYHSLQYSSQIFVTLKMTSSYRNAENVFKLSRLHNFQEES